MRALTPLLALALVLYAMGDAGGQSLTPMERSGTTPTGTKGFKLLVGNPYPTRMTFLVVPMDAEFRTAISGATATPGKVTIASGHARSVIVAFRIDPQQKERTIGLCIVPENFQGPVLPRVCGRYTGRMLKR